MLCCHQRLVYRRVRPVRQRPHRKSAGEVAVRTGRVRPDAVPEPTDAVWQTVTAPAFIADGVGTSHRADVLRSTGRQDADRDPNTRHAAEWRLVQLALHDDAMTSHRWDAASLMTSSERGGDLTMRQKSDFVSFSRS